MLNNNNGGTGNPYSQYLRNVPGNQPELRVGQPINTQWGVGIITDIRGANGGLTHEDYQTGARGVIIVSVLFVGQQAPVDIPLSTLVFTSHTGSPPRP